MIDGAGDVLARHELAGRAEPDVGMVDLVARVALWAARQGATAVVTDASPRTVALLGLAGLPVEVKGQAEGGEEPLGVEEVEEEAHGGDPPP